MNLIRKIWMLIRDPSAEVISAEESADTLYELQRMSQTAGEKVREQRNRNAQIAAEARDQFLFLAGQCEKAAKKFDDTDMRDVWL